jgi:hypothetical protein
VTWAEVERLAQRLPGAERSTSYRRPCFKVGGKAFVTLRPLSAQDRAEVGRPVGELALVRVEHEVAKQAVLENEPACLTTSHFDGWPYVLVELDRAAPELVEELVTESFLVCGGSIAR